MLRSVVSNSFLSDVDTGNTNRAASATATSRRAVATGAAVRLHFKVLITLDFWMCDSISYMELGLMIRDVSCDCSKKKVRNVMETTLYSHPAAYVCFSAWGARSAEPTNTNIMWSCRHRQMASSKRAIRLKGLAPQAASNAVFRGLGRYFQRIQIVSKTEKRGEDDSPCQKNMICGLDSAG